MSQVSTRRRTPVIIDTDPGVDDTLAILLALASPELEILGYVVSYGNTDVDASYLNIFKIYEALARHFERVPEDRARFVNYDPEGPKPFVVKGPSGPLAGELHSAQYFHGRDGLGDISNRHPDLTTGSFIPDTGNTSPSHPHSHPLLHIASTSSAHDLALDIIRARPPRTITYLVLGPMTNLARMVRKDAGVVRERLGRIVSMGGALDVPGNTTPAAEFNYFADPFAVHELLTPDSESPGSHPGLPLPRTLILPLDITTPHTLSFPLYTSTVDPTFKVISPPAAHLASSNSHTAHPSHSSNSPPAVAATAHPSDPCVPGKTPLVHFTSSFMERTREVMLSYGSDAVELHDIVAVWCAAMNPPEGEGVDVEGGDGVGVGGGGGEGRDSDPVLAEHWGAVRRRFQVERYGEHTRGMLVIDRRFDSGAYDSGANRAKAQAKANIKAQLERELTVAPVIITEQGGSIAAPVQVESSEEARELQGEGYGYAQEGVPCVYKTPGSEALVRLMLERIWGVVV